MIFLFNLVSLFATLFILLRIALDSIAPLAAAQQRLKVISTADIKVQKCAGHLANQRNIDEAHRYLCLLFPKHCEEFSRIKIDLTHKIQAWAEEISCGDIDHLPIKPSLRQNRNFHIHPYWPNWVASFTR